MDRDLLEFFIMNHPRLSVVTRNTCSSQLIKVEVGLLVDKDDLVNYPILIDYQLLIRTFTYQPTVDKTIVLSTNC
jgi:hypothetical protein